MGKVLSWHNDLAVKADAIVRMRRHAAADRVIRGSYLLADSQGEWSGCLHGCLLVDKLAEERGVSIDAVASNVQDFEEEIHSMNKRFWGLPEKFGNLIDGLYEGVRAPSSEVALEILDAIPVGVDLDKFFWNFMREFIYHPEFGALSGRYELEHDGDPDLLKEHEQIFRMCDAVVTRFTRLMHGEEFDPEWDILRNVIRDKRDVFSLHSPEGKAWSVLLRICSTFEFDSDISSLPTSVVSRLSRGSEYPDEKENKLWDALYQNFLHRLRTTQPENR